MSFVRIRRKSPEPGDHLSPDERRFALGTRRLADLIAPGCVEVNRNTLRLDSQHTRTLVVTGYPRTVSPGWLAPLVDFEEPIELSLHIHPIESGQMVSLLTHKLVQFSSTRLLEERSGRLADPEREVAYEDTERLRDALSRGDEKVFSVSLYILLRASSQRILDDLTHRVEVVLNGMLARSRVALFEQDSGFRSCLPTGQDELLVYRNLDTSSLATTFPFLSSSLSMERGVLYGIALHSHTPVIFDPFDASLENANMVVFAKSGAGKSYFTKLMALRNLLTGVDFLIVDPEDEYRALCAAAAGQYVRLSATSAQHLNPFDLPADSGTSAAGTGANDGQGKGWHDDDRDDYRAEGRDALAEQVVALIGLLEVMLVGPGQALSPQERATLDRALYQTYAAKGITADPRTHARPAPVLRDLHATLAGEPGESAASLAVRLERYVVGSLAGLFSSPTNVALDRRLVVFNLQDLAPELRPLGTHLVAGFVWNQVRRARRARLLVVDEAWTLMRYPEGGAFLASLARRARKYYLGLVTITQDVGDFLGSESGRTVLANAAVKLLMKQDSSTIGPVVEAFGLSAEERQFLLAAGKGEGLFFARGGHVALKVEGSPSEHRLATTSPRELAKLAAKPGPATGTWPEAGLAERNPLRFDGPSSPSDGVAASQEGWR